ncbi:beta-ketoacyl-[acyl-carrier-protein] synthase family protein [Candidatus Poribacteria bacterium]|nr:beta-ketoacyl-[acyl-carrier-protein] synthase family protein [Candidatus Poribacteria bacterium]
MKRRFVITGLGAIAPNGVGKEAFWKALVEGRSGIDRITSFDASNLPADYMSLKLVERLPRVAQFGVAVAKMAADNARLDDIPSQRIGVAFGANLGKADISDVDHNLFLQKGLRGIDSLSAEKLSPHFSTSHIAMALRTKGPTASFSSGCTATPNAIEWGRDQIQNGYVDAVVVVSSESLLFPFMFSMLCAGPFLSTSSNDQPQKASKPFDVRRDGTVISEGGGAIILEDFNCAFNRGAHIYAELLGVALNSEAVDVRKFDIKGEAFAGIILEAINRSALHPSEIDYISAHGVATRVQDVAETNAIKLAFGSRAYNIPISSIKSMIGISFAPSPAFQVIACCLGLRDSIIPPTINYEVPDPACDLDYVPNKARVVRLRNVLINAEGMGSSYSATILGIPD